MPLPLGYGPAAEFRTPAGQDGSVELRNWAGNITFSAERLHAPTTLEQLQELVATTSRIRALGTRHSFNRIADTTGDLVSVRELVGDIRIDAGAETVSVPAGARYGEVGVALQQQGWALANLGSLPHISVAGACATGTHGGGVDNQCLAAAVRAVEFVRADGELVRVAADDPAFGGSVLNLGALGILTRLELAVEPSYQLRQDVWLNAPLAVVIERFDEIMASGYSISLFSELRRPTIDKIWIKSRGADVVDGRRWGAEPALLPQHPVTGQDPSAVTEQLGAIGSWHERLPHFRLEFSPSTGAEQQSEYLLPAEHAGAALAAIHRLALSPVLQVAEVRSIAADQLWLSPCSGRQTVGLHFTWIDDSARVHDAVVALESALTPFDARPHWGKVFLADPAAHYPRLGDFRRLAAAHDPDRKFGNDFLDQYVYG